MISFQDIKSSKAILSRNLNGLKCLGVETVTVATTNVAQLVKIPDGTVSAEIIVEGSTATTTTIAIRLWQDGTVPTTTTGYILGHLDSYEISNIDNLRNAKFLASETGKTHTLQVMYFGVKP